MNDEELAKIRSTMYRASARSGNKNAATKPKELDFAMEGKFITITVDGKQINIPSSKYVQKLETSIQNQARIINRLTSQTKALQTKVNQLVGEVNDVNRELDKKMNLR